MISLEEYQNISNGNNEKNDLILDIRTMSFCFSGILPNKGIGPYCIDTESITLKPFFTRSKHMNRTAEVYLVSGFPEFKHFFNSFILHNPKDIFSYNYFKSGITERKLKNAANFRFIRNQILQILKLSNHLLIGRGDSVVM